MNFAKNRIFYFLMIFAIVSMLIAGCGGPKDDTNAEGVREQTSAADKEAANENKEPVSLTLYGWTDSGYDVNAVIKRFEAKNPDIKVSFSGVGTKDYSTMLKTKLLTGESVDLVWAHPGSELNALAEAGYLIDLSDAAWTGNFQEGAVKAVSVGEKLYGVPLTQHLIGVYYNKKVFQDNGLKVPETWSELIDVSKKLNEAGIAPFSQALGDWPKGFMSYPLVSSMILSKNPNWYADRTEGKVSFSEWTPIFTKFHDIIQNYTALGAKAALGVKYDQHIQLFTSGKAAMLVNGTWAINDIKKIDADAQVGMFPLNGLDDSSGIVVPQGVGMVLGISKDTKHKDAAMKFVEFMSTAESYNEGDIPVIKGVEGAPEFIKDHMLPAVDKGKTSVFMDVPWPAGFADVFNKSIDLLITGSVEPEALTKDWDKAWDDKIKK